MVQRGQHLGLALEAAQSIGVADHTVGQDLQRDLAIQRGVARAIDLTHSARADKGENLVRSEACSDRESHEGVRDYTGARLPPARAFRVSTRPIQRMARAAAVVNATSGTSASVNFPVASLM